MHGVLLSRTRALQELGFVFDAEEAEWDRWFNQLMLVDPTKPLPLASGDDFLLINWWVSSLQASDAHLVTCSIWAV